MLTIYNRAYVNYVNVFAVVNINTVTLKAVYLDFEKAFE